MANNSGVIKDIKESEGNTGIESKKKAFNDIYDVDTHTLLIQTKKSMEAAKILHKQQKNVKRKREKETSKKLTKCMTKYDDAFEELHETVSSLNQIFEKRPRKIQKTMSAREPKRSKHENFDIEKRSDEKFRSSESHSTDNTAMQRQNDRYRTERSRKEKDDASKSLERISDTHVTIDKYKDQNYSLNQEIQQLKHMLKEKEDITKRFQEENNKIRHELENETKNYANEREAKENALKRLEDMERDKILIEDQHERFVKQLSYEKFSLKENMKRLKEENNKIRHELENETKNYVNEREAKGNALKRLEDMERDKSLSEDQHERFVKQLSDEKFSLEENMKRLQSELDNAIQKYKGEKATKDDALSRLSSLASSKLRDNNPNITDLSDQNRPTKIAEKMAELYDNQWTDAFDALEKEHKEEREIINMLLESLMTAYDECSKLANDNFFEKVQRAFESLKLVSNQSCHQVVLSEQLKLEIKELRKSQAPKVWKEIEAIVLPKICLSKYHQPDIDSYLSRCVEISWLMVVQDPPLALNSKAQGKFDTAKFKEYTIRGPLVEFVVWPALLLHDSGPLLAKGVAQGCELNPLGPKTNDERRLFTQSMGAISTGDNRNQEQVRILSSSFSATSGTYQPVVHNSSVGPPDHESI